MFDKIEEIDVSFNNMQDLEDFLEQSWLGLLTMRPEIVDQEIVDQRKKRVKSESSVKLTNYRRLIEQRCKELNRQIKATQKALSLLDKINDDENGIVTEFGFYPADVDVARRNMRMKLSVLENISRMFGELVTVAENGTGYDPTREAVALRNFTKSMTLRS